MGTTSGHFSRASQIPSARRVLLVDDDSGICGSLAARLKYEGLIVSTAQTGSAALQALGESGFDVVILDLKMPGVDGFGVLRALASRPNGPKVIIHSGVVDVRTVSRAMRAGAVDVFEKPCDVVELLERIHEVTGDKRCRKSVPCISAFGLNKLEPERGPLSGLIGSGEAMERVRHQLRCVAAFPHVAVLIAGPTGTGKELVARATHELTFPGGPYVTVNCAAIPENLLESELFGHEAGAFTNARSSRKGLLEEARGGTIFLDEVGEMPLPLQSKLLRVLESGEYRRVGSNQLRQLDARVVSATNCDLAPGRDMALRQDLYFRLAGYTVRTPALAEHLEDIPQLTRHFLREFASQHHLESAEISAGAMRALSRYDWPGNVRELRRFVEHLGIVSGGRQIDVEDVEDAFSWRVPAESQDSGYFRAGPGPVEEPHSRVGMVGPESASGPPSLPELERKHILQTYEESGGNLSRAARTLGIARSTLRERLKKYRQHA